MSAIQAFTHSGPASHKPVQTAQARLNVLPVGQRPTIVQIPKIGASSFVQTEENHDAFRRLNEEDSETESQT